MRHPIEDCYSNLDLCSEIAQVYLIRVSCKALLKQYINLSVIVSAINLLLSG